MIRHAFGITSTMLGISLLASQAQAAYLVADGQYFNWTAAASGLTTTATPGTDKTHFTAKTNNALAPITQEVVGGNSAARIVDTGTADTWQNVGLLTRTYGTQASTDFDYAVNLGFYVHATGSTSTMLLLEEWSSTSQTQRTMSLGAQKNSGGTGYNLWLNLGGTSVQPIGGSSNYYSFDTWYDVSIHRLTQTTYDMTVVNRATQQSWSQSVTNTALFSSLIGQSINIGSGTNNRQYTMDVAFDSLKIGEVPEPASLSLLGLGVMLALPRRKAVSV